MWSGIALFYFACLLFGFLIALIGAVFGELGGGEAGIDGGHELDIGHDVDVGHDLDLGHDVDAGSHALDVSSPDGGSMPETSVLNTITMATFLGFFGLAGLLAVWALKLQALASFAFALPVAMLIAAAQFLLYVKVFVRSQASSEATMSEILGCEADVITPIPAQRVGEITYVIKGSRYTAPAASADGEEIAKGTRVQIVNIRGTTLVVRPI